MSRHNHSRLSHHGLIFLGFMLTVSCLRPGAAFADDAADVAAPPEGINLIKHIIIIVQENRSFDQYFGTFPGADGIPMVDGKPTVCLNDPVTQTCVAPYHDRNDVDYAGPHKAGDARDDIDGGKMDGFIEMAREQETTLCHMNKHHPVACEALKQPPDVMGYHDDSDIPNYWAYASNFVLQDHMFEPAATWSLPSHLFLVSGWSAVCENANHPMSCKNALDGPSSKVAGELAVDPRVGGYAWTDLTYLLHKKSISWAYYVMHGFEPDCDDDEMFCTPQYQDSAGYGYWNPLPSFSTVKDNGQLGNIKPVTSFLDAARRGTLPQVCWIVPSQDVSEHAPGSIIPGQNYVTALINAVMRGPEWKSTAIFVVWDDWGGFYDHETPPTVDENGYGLRVPGLVISPYAKVGYIDHQVLSFDAYLKFIEDRFLDGARLDPATDGRPDPRPTVRENVPILGDLRDDFDFGQAPRAPLILPLRSGRDGKIPALPAGFDPP